MSVLDAWGCSVLPTWTSPRPHGSSPPKVSDSREQGRGCDIFYDLALETTHTIISATSYWFHMFAIFVVGGAAHRCEDQKVGLLGYHFGGWLPRWSGVLMTVICSSRGGHNGNSNVYEHFLLRVVLSPDPLSPHSDPDRWPVSSLFYS